MEFDEQTNEPELRINAEAYIGTVGFMPAVPPDLTEPERDILARFLESKVAKKTFRLLSFDIEGLKEGVFLSDLEVPNKMANALKMQGAARGITMALSAMIEIANGTRTEEFPEREEE